MRRPVGIASARLLQRLYDAQRAVCDVAEVVWKTYGVTSKEGRYAERLVLLSNTFHGMCRDLGEARGESIEAAVRIGAAPNRYHPDGRMPTPRPLPRRLAFELHQRIGDDLKRIHRTCVDADASLGAVNTRRAVPKGWMRRFQRTLGKLRSALDERVANEHGERQHAEVVSCYYGELARLSAPVLLLHNER